MNSKELLNKYLIGFWEKIVVPGGRLERSPSSSAYLLFGICLYCKKNWIEISAVEYKPDEYWLSFSLLDEVPVPDRSNINYPRKKFLNSFPEDCRLDKLSSYGVKEVIVENLECVDKNLLSDNTLKVLCSSGDQFEIAASIAFPCNIEIKSV